MSNKEIKAWKAHAEDVLSYLKEARDLAESGCDPSGLLEIAQSSLTYLLSQIDPENHLAIALLQDASKIECRYDKSEFLIVAATRILNQIENQTQPKSLYDMINNYTED